jgi:site-specific recombinase XerD
MATLKKRTYPSGKIVWSIDDYRNGRRIRKVIGNCDKKTAEQIYIKYLADRQKNRFGVFNLIEVKLESFIKKYSEYAKTIKSPGTNDREDVVLKPFKEYFKNRIISQISFEEIEGYRRDRLKRVTIQTVNLEFRHLKAIFNWALTHNFISVNPFMIVKPIRSPESNLPRFFELEEISEIRKFFSEDSMKDLIEFYLLTGTRLNEALILTRDDIDFRRKLIKIPGTHTKNKRHRIISFKTDRKLARLLKNLLIREDNYLFGIPGGDRWSPKWVSSKISHKLSDHNFPWASYHTFRHTYISHLIMSGVPITTVKEIVGHSSINTTLKYAHLEPSHTQEMISKRPY